MSKKGLEISEQEVEIREIFLDAEKEYLQILQQEVEFRNQVDCLSRKFYPSQLMEMAKRRMEKFEFGLVDEEKTNKLETEILMLLKAIDAAYKKMDLTKTKYDNGRDL